MPCLIHDGPFRLPLPDRRRDESDAQGVGGEIEGQSGRRCRLQDDEPHALGAQALIGHLATLEDPPEQRPLLGLHEG